MPRAQLIAPAGRINHVEYLTSRILQGRADQPEGHFFLRGLDVSGAEGASATVARDDRPVP